MRRALGLVLCVWLLMATQAAAQETRYGAGAFFDRSVPVMGFDARYSASEMYGVTLDYWTSNRVALEFEYHHVTMDNGKIETLSFAWPIDKKRYLSPEASSRFNLNSFLINALAYLRPRTSGSDIQLLPYVTVGAGFYDFQDRISGLIYPGQRVEPLDPDLHLEPIEDEKTALGANVGLGMTIVQGRFGLDVRSRYNVILGDLRPLEAWGLNSVFPLTTVDFRTTFKVYW